MAEENHIGWNDEVFHPAGLGMFAGCRVYSLRFFGLRKAAREIGMTAPGVSKRLACGRMNYVTVDVGKWNSGKRGTRNFVSERGVVLEAARHAGLEKIPAIEFETDGERHCCFTDTEKLCRLEKSRENSSVGGKYRAVNFLVPAKPENGMLASRFFVGPNWLAKATGGKRMASLVLEDGSTKPAEIDGWDARLWFRPGDSLFEGALWHLRPQIATWEHFAAMMTESAVERCAVAGWKMVGREDSVLI